MSQTKDYGLYPAAERFGGPVISPLADNRALGLPSWGSHSFPKITGERRSQHLRACCEWHVGLCDSCRASSRAGSCSGDPGSSWRHVPWQPARLRDGLCCTLGRIQKVAMAIHRHRLPGKRGFAARVAPVFEGYFQRGCTVAASLHVENPGVTPNFAGNAPSLEMWPHPRHFGAGLSGMVSSYASVRLISFLRSLFHPSPPSTHFTYSMQDWDVPSQLCDIPKLPPLHQPGPPHSPCAWGHELWGLRVCTR